MNALAEGANRELFVGGLFSSLGVGPSSMIACWRGAVTQLDVPSPQAQAGTRLLQNAPNPCTDRTNVAFQLEAASIVTLDLYDVMGRRVTSAIEKQWLPAGRHEASFDKSAIAPGVYLCRLSAGASHSSRRLVVLEGGH